MIVLREGVFFIVSDLSKFFGGIEVVFFIKSKFLGVFVI